ncbi:hypothetical protein, partial [Microseira sp. BLCC-F43]|uniref:hypothetical protein n=1 Tax=Microseira sp. BLCC-F43 TaxID=3153602 RepID=UPI0035B948B1
SKVGCPAENLPRSPPLARGVGGIEGRIPSRKSPSIAPLGKGGWGDRRSDSQPKISLDRPP